MVAQHMEASPGIIEQRMRARLGDNPEPMSPQVSHRMSVHQLLHCLMHACCLSVKILSVATRYWVRRQQCRYCRRRRSAARHFRTITPRFTTLNLRVQLDFVVQASIPCFNGFGT